MSVQVCVFVHCCTCAPLPVGTMLHVLVLQKAPCSGGAQHPSTAELPQAVTGRGQRVPHQLSHPSHAKQGSHTMRRTALSTCSLGLLPQHPGRLRAPSEHRGLCRHVGVGARVAGDPKHGRQDVRAEPCRVLPRAVGIAGLSISLLGPPVAEQLTIFMLGIYLQCSLIFPDLRVCA